MDRPQGWRRAGAFIPRTGLPDRRKSRWEQRWRRLSPQNAESPLGKTTPDERVPAVIFTVSHCVGWKTPITRPHQPVIQGEREAALAAAGPKCRSAAQLAFLFFSFYSYLNFPFSFESLNLNLHMSFTLKSGVTLK
jgi:hypothetical protein